MNVKKLMWAYLIKHGTTKPFSYYGSGYTMHEDHERNTHLDVLRKISREGVDWEKTREPRDGMESQFTDTFNEPDDVTVLAGTLVTKTGKKYHFGSNWDGPRNVFEMFAELSELDFDDALKQKCLGKSEK
jgi:hypothetical protein